MWDLIVSVPDHCLPFYFLQKFVSSGHKSGICTKALIFFVYITRMSIE